jgi:hypothetical protein
MSLTCHLESKEPPPWTLHPFEDVEVDIYGVAFDNERKPLWRGRRSLLLYDIMIGSTDVAHVT